ncbi:unnamed protein product [Closterium sp. Yama58-4]|nr:unnamed protein product [Closterium sp. Yama58-4]
MQLMQEQREYVHDGLMLRVANMAARAGHTPLIEHVWDRLVRRPYAPSPAFHLARIHAYSAAANFPCAFRAALHLQTSCCTLARAPQRPPPLVPRLPQVPPRGGVTGSGAPLEELNPFTSLRPLTLALCSSVDVLDKGYSMLEGMHAQGEVVALAALNCVVAGCAMQRDVGRAQLTLDEITRTFGLQPDTHSFNALMDCYSGVADVRTVVQLFEHMTRTLHLPPTTDTYTILVDAHIRAFDAPGACIAMDKMVEAGFTPSRPLLLRLRRRCLCSGLSEGVARAEGVLQALRFRTVNADERRRRLHLAHLPPSVADPRLAARTQGRGQREGGQRWGRRRWEQQGQQEQQGEQRQQAWQEGRRQEGEAGSPGM